MSVDEYWPHFMGTIAAINFIYFLGKFFYNRYSEGLDQRISTCISEKTSEKMGDHEKRIGGLEREFKMLKDFFIPKDNRIFGNENNT